MSQYCVENYWIAGYAEGDISSAAAAMVAASTASIGAAITLDTGYRTQATSVADVAAIRRIFQAFKAAGSSTTLIGAPITVTSAAAMSGTSQQNVGAGIISTRQSAKMIATSQMQVSSRLKWELETEPSDSWANITEPSDSWTSVTEGSATWTDKLLPHETNDDRVN